MHMYITFTCTCTCTCIATVLECMFRTHWNLKLHSNVINARHNDGGSGEEEEEDEESWGGVNDTSIPYMYVIGNPNV